MSAVKADFFSTTHVNQEINFRRTMKRPVKALFFIFFVLIFAAESFSQSAEKTSKFTIARVKYNGGGDWYNDPSILPNMLAYLRKNTNIDAGTEEARVSLTDDDLFSYPILFLTGHGRIIFSDEEAKRLRLYLQNGGFLYADDDYGMDKYFRQEMKKVFPDKKLVEIPFSHEIYHIHFDFPNGLPKIHEHDGKPPRGYGYFHEGRLVVYYTYETNISDGWADPDVHKDPPAIREQAFKMGTNIIVYALLY